MKEYVLGFAFSLDGDSVVLIEKNKPKWQKGFLNGLGGKVKPSDYTYSAAMAREFEEESGMKTDPTDWQQFAELKGKDYLVVCFKLFLDHKELKKVYSNTDEKVDIWATSAIDSRQGPPVIDNLYYLIPVALDDKLIGAVTFEYD